MSPAAASSCVLAEWVKSVWEKEPMSLEHPQPACSPSHPPGAPQGAGCMWDHKSYTRHCWSTRTCGWLSFFSNLSWYHKIKELSCLLKSISHTFQLLFYLRYPVRYCTKFIPFNPHNNPMEEGTMYYYPLFYRWETKPNWRFSFLRS